MGSSDRQAVTRFRPAPQVGPCHSISPQPSLTMSGALEGRDETAQGFDVATRDDAPFRASIPARNDVAIEFPEVGAAARPQMSVRGKRPIVKASGEVIGKSSALAIREFIDVQDLLAFHSPSYLNSGAFLSSSLLAFILACHFRSLLSYLIFTESASTAT